jgi:hypothetical protein
MTNAQHPLLVTLSFLTAKGMDSAALDYLTALCGTASADVVSYPGV